MKNSQISLPNTIKWVTWHKEEAYIYTYLSVIVTIGCCLFLFLPLLPLLDLLDLRPPLVPVTLVISISFSSSSTAIDMLDSPPALPAE